MTSPARMTILLVACLVLNIQVAQPQTKKESSTPEAGISEAIASLKSLIPFSYLAQTRN